MLRILGSLPSNCCLPEKQAAIKIEVMTYYILVGNDHVWIPSSFPAICCFFGMWRCIMSPSHIDPVFSLSYVVCHRPIDSVILYETLKSGHSQKITERKKTPHTLIIWEVLTFFAKYQKTQSTIAGGGLFATDPYPADDPGRNLFTEVHLIFMPSRKHTYIV